MTCETIKIGNTVAIVCGRGLRRKRCACGRPATRLCDHPKPRRGTCDAPLCDRCAVNIGPDRDLCPACSAERSSAVRPSAGGPT